MEVSCCNLKGSDYLVPKLYLGMSFSRQLHCRTCGEEGKRLSLATHGEVQLRRSLRSQVKLGNECLFNAPSGSRTPSEMEHGIPFCS